MIAPSWAPPEELHEKSRTELQVEEKHLATRIGTLVGFVGPPVRHSGLNHRAVLDFCVDSFVGCGLSGPLRLRVQSRSRMRLRIAASIAFLFRARFQEV